MASCSYILSTIDKSEFERINIGKSNKLRSTGRLQLESYKPRSPIVDSKMNLKFDFVPSSHVLATNIEDRFNSGNAKNVSESSNSFTGLLQHKNPNDESQKYKIKFHQKKGQQSIRNYFRVVPEEKTNHETEMGSLWPTLRRESNLPEPSMDQIPATSQHIPGPIGFLPSKIDRDNEDVLKEQIDAAFSQRATQVKRRVLTKEVSIYTTLSSAYHQYTLKAAIANHGLIQDFELSPGCSLTLANVPLFQAQNELYIFICPSNIVAVHKQRLAKVPVILYDRYADLDWTVVLSDLLEYTASSRQAEIFDLSAIEKSNGEHNYLFDDSFFDDF
ncbi:hypothetical protein ACOME3_001183 [Neoechinorhynchus agilis]